MIVTASDARATLPDLLDRVADGEEVTITRHGQPAAVLVRPDSLRSRRAAELFKKADELHALIESARHLELSSLPGLSNESAEELVASVRASRDAR
jgi:prevent-host-death family protein